MNKCTVERWGNRFVALYDPYRQAIILKYTTGQVTTKERYDNRTSSFPTFPPYEVAMQLLAEFLLKEAL